jgi:GWxTD domain-containing protein
VAFRRAGDLVAQIASDETVRVATFTETLRSDESIIFQHYVTVPPGRFSAIVSVRDRRGSAFNQDEREIVIPRFDATPRVTAAVLVYEGKARSDRRALPQILLNPRITAPYGTDSLDLYVEGYGLTPGATADVRATNDDGLTLWHGTAAFRSGGAIDGAIVRLSPADLPVGELHIETTLPGSADTTRGSMLLSFSDRWAIANFDELLLLLKYFGQDEALRKLKDASAEDRPRLWRAFWKATDPNPSTPENEALVEYFQRLQAANIRFQEGNDPGWLTDRGEVYVTLGEPDEVYDQSSDLQGQRRFIRWTYVTHRLQLDFLDDAGFGRFRLTPASRSDYLRVWSRLRRSGG